MGFASSPETRDTLAGYGIRVTGYTWRWALGLQGGTFPPHREINGEREPTPDSFAAYPGEDVNGSSCMCRLVPEYRTPDGRFARPDNLQPIFQPPVTAAMELYRPPELDLQPFVGQLSEFVDQLAQIDRNITVQLLPPPAANVYVDAPVVNVPAPVTNVTVEAQTIPAPNVTVETPTVNVAAPTVKVEPQIDVKPVVKVIREKAKRVRFRRNADGRIESAEVTEQ